MSEGILQPSESVIHPPVIIPQAFYPNCVGVTMENFNKPVELGGVEGSFHPADILEHVIQQVPLRRVNFTQQT